MQTQQITFDQRQLTDEFLLELYQDILFPRMIEEKMLVSLRQGKISKWFSGIGQEAIAVGLTKALQSDDYILPLHRNLGVFTTRQVELKKLFCQWIGRPSGYTQGRDRSFHFGSPEERIIGMISHLGAMLPVADGLALASKLDDEKYVAAVFSGDGGASEGDFHEALNVAAVWDLPVIFVLENNGYGLSTPSSQQFRCKQFIDKAIGYGIEGVQVDGNNVLDVYHTVKEIAEKMRKNPKPVLLEAMTFRMRGHEEASGTKYVPKELFEQWGQKDPLKSYEQFLVKKGLLESNEIIQIRKDNKTRISQALDKAFEEADLVPSLEKETAEIYAPSTYSITPPSSQSKEMRFVDAVSDGLKESMRKHPELVLMGQDIADYGGVFKITEGFVEEFGRDRVRNTPLCESAIIGAGFGLSLRGKKAMVEMQFADFVSCGFNQIVNNLAKTHYRWNHAPDVVVRMPTGAGVGAGPFHSQSNESWFTHVPGLKVLYPSTAADAKGLLATAILDPNPVIFFEHKVLYRNPLAVGQVPEGYYNVPIGKARIAQEGDEITIVTYGMGVYWALEAAKQMPDTSIEIVDLRSLVPWDEETVFGSVKKTGKCVVLYEDTQTGAFGAEIAASISEHCFEYLDGPVKRLGSLDTPVPFNVKLEDQFLAKARLMDVLEDLAGY